MMCEAAQNSPRQHLSTLEEIVARAGMDGVVATAGCDDVIAVARAEIVVATRRRDGEVLDTVEVD